MCTPTASAKLVLGVRRTSFRGGNYATDPFVGKGGLCVLKIGSEELIAELLAIPDARKAARWAWPQHGARKGTCTFVWAGHGMVSKRAIARLGWPGLGV